MERDFYSLCSTTWQRVARGSGRLRIRAAAEAVDGARMNIPLPEPVMWTGWPVTDSNSALSSLSFGAARIAGSASELCRCAGHCSTGVVAKKSAGSCGASSSGESSNAR